MSTPELQRMLESASRAGLELDSAEAEKWLAAVDSAGKEEITLDHRTGVFGHRVAMLDFNPADLAHFPRSVRSSRFLTSRASSRPLCRFPAPPPNRRFRPSPVTATSLNGST